MKFLSIFPIRVTLRSAGLLWVCCVSLGQLTATWEGPQPSALPVERREFRVVQRLDDAGKPVFGKFAVEIPVDWEFREAGVGGLSYYVINRNIPQGSTCRQFFLQYVFLNDKMLASFTANPADVNILSSDDLQAGEFAVKRSMAAPYPGNPDLHEYSLKLINGNRVIAFSASGLSGDMAPILPVLEQVARSVVLDGSGIPIEPSSPPAPSSEAPAQSPTDPGTSGAQASDTPSPAPIAAGPGNPRRPLQAGFFWVGRNEDKVGEWASAVPNGVQDLCFELVLDLPQERNLEYINVHLCDENGNRQPSYWFSRDFDRGWILGVYENGNLLNPHPGLGLGRHRGTRLFTLYANDSSTDASAKTYFQVEYSLDGEIFTEITNTSDTSRSSAVNAHDDAEILNTTNKEAVSGFGASPSFTIDRAYRLVFVMTYHYFNEGRGPGVIALRHSDGTLYGPWPATGRAGQGGVANANWDVYPDNVVLQPGSYTVLDSDPATWSTNAASGFRGHAIVRGRPESR